MDYVLSFANNVLCTMFLISLNDRTLYCVKEAIRLLMEGFQSYLSWIFWMSQGNSITQQQFNIRRPKGISNFDIWILPKWPQGPSPMWVQVPKDLDHYLLLSHGIRREPDWKQEQLGPKLTPMWDASADRWRISLLLPFLNKQNFDCLEDKKGDGKAHHLVLLGQAPKHPGHLRWWHSRGGWAS